MPIFGDGLISTHADPTKMPRDIPRTSHLYWTNRPVCGPHGFVRFWPFGGAKFPKMGRFPAFDADEPPCTI